MRMRAAAIGGSVASLVALTAAGWNVYQRRDAEGGGKSAAGGSSSVLNTPPTMLQQHEGSDNNGEGNVREGTQVPFLFTPPVVSNEKLDVSETEVSKARYWEFAAKISKERQKKVQQRRQEKAIETFQQRRQEKATETSTPAAVKLNVKNKKKKLKGKKKKKKATDEPSTSHDATARQDSDATQAIASTHKEPQLM